MSETVFLDSLDGWPFSSSPYHAGEAAMQEQAGVRERAERQGRRMIRGMMPDQHRALFEALPYLFLGSLDTQGRPWAAMLAGPPGFAVSPDPRILIVDAAPVPAPFGAALAVGAPVGLLGIELATRRRNRMNGRILAASGTAFAVGVDQSFGNCPQYIQARDVVATTPQAAHGSREEGSLLSGQAAALVRAADTFFIASASAHAGADKAVEGVDISHRGGKPGFVRVTEQDGTTVLTAPDFRGNNAFNTFGNLAVNPRAGLLFLDFASGGLLSLTGRAEVLWDVPEIAAYYGAKRLLRVRVDAGILIEGAVPFRWTDPVQAPQLAATGAWV
jgi:uncharacterized protein